MRSDRCTDVACRCRVSRSGQPIGVGSTGSDGTVRKPWMRFCAWQSETREHPTARPPLLASSLPPERPAGHSPRTRLWPGSAREHVSARTVFSPYVQIFRAVPGARGFSFAGWLARLPMPILGLGAVLLVADATGSYGL